MAQLVAGEPGQPGRCPAHAYGNQVRSGGGQPEGLNHRARHHHLGPAEDS